jgi:hypothetical protein
VSNRVKIVTIIFIVILINAAGLLLKYFGLDSYIIFAGFRFYLSLILPFLIVFRHSQLGSIKEKLIHPEYNRTFQPLGWILLPLLILLASLYFSKQIDIGDPDYFYEFGLSSVIDYPIYIIWNLPQLLMFALFLILIQPTVKSNCVISFFIAAACFIFAFVTFNKTKPNYFDIVSVMFILASAVLILKYFQNVYWFSIIVFTVVWTNILAFGSSSQTMIHLMFASQYNTWEGFFDVGNSVRQYLLPAQLGIAFILIAVSALLKKTNPDIIEKKP